MKTDQLKSFRETASFCPNNRLNTCGPTRTAHHIHTQTHTHEQCVAKCRILNASVGDKIAP